MSYNELLSVTEEYLASKVCKCVCMCVCVCIYILSPPCSRMY